MAKKQDSRDTLWLAANNQKEEIRRKVAAERKALAEAEKINATIRKLEMKIDSLKKSDNYLTAFEVNARKCQMTIDKEKLKNITNSENIKNIKKEKLRLLNGSCQDEQPQQVRKY